MQIDEIHYSSDYSSQSHLSVNLSSNHLWSCIKSGSMALAMTSSVHWILSMYGNQKLKRSANGYQNFA